MVGEIELRRTGTSRSLKVIRASFMWVSRHLSGTSSTSGPDPINMAKLQGKNSNSLDACCGDGSSDLEVTEQIHCLHGCIGLADVGHGGIDYTTRYKLNAWLPGGVTDNSGIMKYLGRGVSVNT